MKRQIFWLIFSCFTATNFLSYSMEADISEVKESDTVTLVDGEDTTKQVLVPTSIYPELPELIDTAEEQSLFTYVCDKLQILDEDKLEDFLLLQIGKLVKMLSIKKPNWDKFATSAFDNFFQTVIDKEKATLLLTQLQEHYLPGMVTESVEDSRMNIIVLMILEKAVEYAEQAAEDAEEGVQNIWNDELTQGLIEWAGPHLNSWCHTAIKKYMEEYPLLDTDEKDAKVISKNSAITDKPTPILLKKMLELTARIKDLEKQLRIKANLIKKLERQLTRSQNGQPSSDGIMLINGAILGWGGYFILSMLSRATCDYLPCVEHFEPDTMLGSLGYATLGSILTSGCLYYLRDMKTFKGLLATLLSQSGSTAVKTWLTINQLLNYLKRKPIKQKDKQAKAITRRKLNAWDKLEDSLLQEQINLLSDDFQVILMGVTHGNAENIKQFLTFYAAFVRYAEIKRPTSKQKARFQEFADFIDSLDEDQAELFNQAIRYLKSLNPGEKF